MSYEVKGAAGNISAGQVSINTSTATLVVAARQNRRRLLLKDFSNFYIGTSVVTNSTGYLVDQPVGAGSVGIELETADAVYAVSPGSNSVVQFLEIYD